MPQELQVGGWIRSKTVNHSGVHINGHYQITEVRIGQRGHYTFKIEGSGNRWSFNEIDFEYLGLDEAEDDGEIEFDVPPEDLYPWQRVAPAPAVQEYEGESVQWCLLIRPVGNPELPPVLITYRTRAAAEADIGFHQRSGYEVLRAVKITLGYN